MFSGGIERDQRHFILSICNFCILHLLIIDKNKIVYYYITNYITVNFFKKIIDSNFGFFLVFLS